MKTYTELVNESITIPQFQHQDLITPRDPEGKFWKTIGAANEAYDKASKNTYTKASKLAKDLYSLLVTMGNDDEIKQARSSVSDVVKLIDKSADGAVEEMSSSDIKMLNNYLYMISKIEEAFENSSWFKNSRIDIKAGYVPFRGSAKDPKIKYRMLFNLESPVSDNIVKDINKNLIAISPIHSDYVAGIEWKKDNSAFSVLFSNSPGYKRT